MTVRRIRSFALAGGGALLLSLAACGDDDGGTPPPPPPADMGGGVDMGAPDDSGAPDDAGVPVDMPSPVDLGVDAMFPAGALTLSGTARDFNSEAPLVGAQVCVVEPAGGPCATTDAEGAFRLEGMPEDTNVLVTFAATGYFPIAVTVRMRSTDVTVNYTIPMRDVVNSLARLVSGTRADPTKGHVFVQTARTAGVTTTIAPMTGEGPVYTSGGLPSPAASSTTADGTGIYANFTPGEYEITFTPPPGNTCVDTEVNWPAGENKSRLRILADHITSLTMDCRVATP
jgi:hypothetical protein